MSTPTGVSHNRNESTNPSSHRATSGPTMQARPSYSANAKRALSDELLDGAAGTNPASSQRSQYKEARPADNQTAVVPMAPSRGRETPTTAGRRDMSEPDVELDTPSRRDQVRPVGVVFAPVVLILLQPAAGADNPQRATAHPLSPSKSSGVPAPGEPRAAQNERITTPGPISSSLSKKLHTQPRPSAIPPSSGTVLPTQTLQETNGNTSLRIPTTEGPEKRKQSPLPYAGSTREKDANRPGGAQQGDRTASTQPSTQPSAYSPPSLNRPSVSTSSPASRTAPASTKTASSGMRSTEGMVRDGSQAQSGAALSEFRHPHDEDKRKALPSEQYPKKPLVTQTKLSQPPGYTPASTEPLSRQQPVPKPSHLDRSHSRIQGNEGGDREDMRAKGGASPQKERELPVAPQERRTRPGDSAKTSGNAPHLKVEPSSTSTNASDTPSYLITPPASPVARVNSSGPSSGYDLSAAQLHDTKGSQGKAGQPPGPVSSFGRKEISHAPPPAESQSTQSQPKPVVGVLSGNNNSTVSHKDLRPRPPSVAGDSQISLMSSLSRQESTGGSASKVRVSSEARVKGKGPVPTMISSSINPASIQLTSQNSPSTQSLRSKGDDTFMNFPGDREIKSPFSPALVDSPHGTSAVAKRTSAEHLGDTAHVRPSGNKASIVFSLTLRLLTSPLPSLTAQLSPTGVKTSPTLTGQPQGEVTGETEELPGLLPELLSDFLGSPNEYKGIVPPDEKGYTDLSGEPKGLLLSLGHTTAKSVTPLQHNSQPPVAFRAVPSSSSDFAQIFHTGGSVKQRNSNLKLRQGNTPHDAVLAPTTVDTMGENSQKPRTGIAAKAGGETAATQPLRLETPQQLVIPTSTQQPTETRTQLSPLERNDGRAGGAGPGPPGDEPPGPPGNGVPGPHRDRPRGQPSRPAATPRSTEGQQAAASAASTREPESPEAGGCCSSVLSFFKSCIEACLSICKC
jgi:hypothetical protein